MVSHSRRRLLRSGLVATSASLAGCAAGFGGGSECSAGRTRHESDVELPETAAWPAYKYDAANSGYNPDATGPSERVETAWRYSACTEADSGVVVSDGRAFAGGLVVDGRTGRVAGGDWHGHMSTPAVADGTLYVGASDLEARDAATGELRWTFRTDADAGALPAPTVESGTVYVPGSIDDPTVYAVDAADGEEVWRFETDADVEVPAAVAEGTAYVVDEASTVYALDAETGEQRWRTTPPADVAYSVPTVAGDRIHLGSRGSGVLALRTADGSTVWHQRGDRTDGGIGGGVAVAEGTVFAAGEGTVAALDAADGRVAWQVSTDVDGLDAPAVADGVVYVGAASRSGPGAVLALDAASGAERWRVETREVLFGDYARSGVTASPAVADGAVYVATAPGDIYALVGR